MNRQVVRRVGCQASIEKRLQSLGAAQDCPPKLEELSRIAAYRFDGRLSTGASRQQDFVEVDQQHSGRDALYRGLLLQRGAGHRLCPG
jgi:hypothetical protein